MKTWQNLKGRTNYPTDDELVIITCVLALKNQPIFMHVPEEDIYNLMCASAGVQIDGMKWTENAKVVSIDS